MIDQCPTVIFVADDVSPTSASVILQSIPMMLRHVERLQVTVLGVREERLLLHLRQYAPVVRVQRGADRKEIQALFAAADLTIIPLAWREDLPVVIQDSFQVGAPVVGPAIGDFSELIREGETGYLFPVGDAATLAAKVILHFSLLADERQRMRRRCGEKAQAHAKQARYTNGT